MWKMIDGNVGVKCRLAVRGFKDKFQDLGAYAGTTSRPGLPPVDCSSGGSVFRFN